MAAPKPQSIRRLKGALVQNPTNTTAPPHYGGTPLGPVTNLRFLPGLRGAPLPEEELGLVVEFVEAPDSAVMMCVSRGLDDDLLSLLFRLTSTGASTLHTMAEGRVSGTDGTGATGAGLASDRAIKLLFVPEDTDRDPFVLLYNAIPVRESAAEIQMSMGREAGIACVFYAATDSTYRTYAWGRISDLTL